MAKSDDTRGVRCSFCGKRQEQVSRIIAGQGATYICNECVSLCTSILADELIPMNFTRAEQHEMEIGRLPKPADMRATLDEYAIGQEEAKIALSVAV